MARILRMYLLSLLVGAWPWAGIAGADSSGYPLKASADCRYLVDQKDLPYLIHGDTPWALFYATSDAEAEEFLEDRRLKGFNTMQVGLLPHPGMRRPKIWPFASREDLSTPNEAYFSRVDRILRMGAAKGMQFSINPLWFHAWKAVLPRNGLEKVRKYGEYVGNRYRTFDNIIWLEGGDFQGVEASMMDYLDALAGGLAARDRRHLQTVHDQRSGQNEQQYVHKPWYTLLNVYHYGPIQERALLAYSLKPRLPFFLSESCYEGEHLDWKPPGTAWRARVQAYCAVLCGASGHIVGATPTLYWFEKDWRKVMNSPMYQTIVHLKPLFDSRPWQLMVPDGYPKREVVTAGGGTKWDYVPAARASDGSFIMAYLPRPTTITVDMTKIAGGEVTAWWFNPRDGKAAQCGKYANSGSRRFTPPSSAVDDDWVLVLDDASKNCPQPGGRRSNP
jgi:hypothetical protein